MAQFKERVKEFLSSNTTELLGAHNVIEIDSKTPVYDAFQTLLDNNILAAPVWDASESQYVGFLDVRDLVSWVVFVFDEQKVQDNTRLVDLIQHGQGQFKMNGTDGVTVSYLSRRHRFQPVSPGEPLTKVVELLSKGMHRVPVVKDSKVIRIISQSNILQAITKHVDGVTFDLSSDLSLGELNLGTKNVLSVSRNATVIDTFREMDRKQRSGIALINDTGRIEGTTTAKDLGLFIHNPSLASLRQSIFDYLKTVRAQQIEIKAPLITVYTTDKLTRAVALLSATKVHRVFIVDSEESFKATAVLSITDIFNFLTS